MTNQQNTDSRENPSRVVLVTGGNRGLGFEISRQFCRAGFTVILTSRDIASGKLAKDRLNSKNVHLFQLDITSEESIYGLFDIINKKFNRIDILINNAGVLLDPRSYGKGENGTIFDIDIRILKSSIETNSIGPFIMCQTFIPLMIQNNYGRVVNVSSQSSQLSRESYGVPCYRFSKTALNGVTRVFADETKSNNILVNSVCPVWVKTDMGGPNATLEPEDAVETIMWAATLPDEGPSGKFFQEKMEIAW
jgi:NAD(P)-dependent dehydrogenase (short-subunit alcohol dehydrogenase family)